MLYTPHTMLYIPLIILTGICVDIDHRVLTEQSETVVRTADADKPRRGDAAVGARHKSSAIITLETTLSYKVVIAIAETFRM